MNNTYRIISGDIRANNNSYITGINNHDLIVGASGSGKTRSYVKPNISCIDESFIVADTKGNLYYEFKDSLERRGFDVELIDMVIPANSTIGYNPLDFIHYDEDGLSLEEDIIKLASTMVRNSAKDDPIWSNMARSYIEMLISFVMDFARRDEHNLNEVNRIAKYIGSPYLKRILAEATETMPDGLVATRLCMTESIAAADKFVSSIAGFVHDTLKDYVSSFANYLYTRDDRIDFKRLGETKTALFVHISDTDKSQYPLVSLMYSQALQELVAEADNNTNSALDVPVRLFLDDFASFANGVISNFPQLISVIRSRNISVSIMIQSIAQLKSSYGPYDTQTILDNCETQVFLGSQSTETASYFAIKCNKPLSQVLEMPLDQSLVFVRGTKPRMVNKYSNNNLSYPITSRESNNYKERTR